ncbi:transcriptional regulator [Microbacterium amylolyticum]|uniref:DNA-binding MarR family transcriptional regulator n=1 Tax=Microbacterium amylolyticum TaxID=936337 RepID=A0ABS4ZGF7_9MICO|nr:transcriptional regulator [Microbacterium amylolyticum]MBP2436065.1 DNA-binding MarR family transcriptional regulator [Microbacterium amylolyticum]
MRELDPVIHVQARLRIVTVLDTLGPGDSLAFPRLQEIISVTSGNLATHLRKLEESGYVTIEKVLEGRSAVTYIRLSEDGRIAFRLYKRDLRELLDS